MGGSIGKRITGMIARHHGVGSAISRAEYESLRKAGPTGMAEISKRTQSYNNKEQKTSGYSTYSAGGGKTSTLG